MNLYLDDDSIDPRLVRLLRNAGHEVTLPAQAGRAGGSDAQHLVFAIRNSLALMTRNFIHFRDLHEVVLASGGSHSGILIVYMENDRRRDFTPRGIAAAIARLEASGVPLAD